MSALSSPSAHVLVADDDNALCDLLVTLLQMEGYTTDEAASLEEACEKVDSNLYDLVLTDLFSSFPPRLEGIQRLQQRCYPTPVAILSGWHIAQQAAQRAGFAFALEKPFDLHTLLQHIADHLRPVLSPLQQGQARCIRSCLADFNAHHWGALRAHLALEVAYLPLTHNVFPIARALFGQEAFLAHIQGVLGVLPGFRMDCSVMKPHAQELVTRFLGSWQGMNSQHAQIAGAAFFHVLGERIHQIRVTVYTPFLPLLPRPSLQATERR